MSAGTCVGIFGAMYTLVLLEAEADAQDREVVCLYDDVVFLCSGRTCRHSSLQQRHPCLYNACTRHHTDVYI
jgi:hypothetical protein